MSWPDLKALNISCLVIDEQVDLMKPLTQLTRFQGVQPLNGTDLISRRPMPGKMTTPITLTNGYYVLLIGQSLFSENSIYKYNGHTKSLSLLVRFHIRDLFEHYVYSSDPLDEIWYCTTHTAERVWEKKLNDFKTGTYEYVKRIHKDNQEIKKMLLEIYHAPGMPGYLQAQSSYMGHIVAAAMRKREEEPRSLEEEEEKASHTPSITLT